MSEKALEATIPFLARSPKSPETPDTAFDTTPTPVPSTREVVPRTKSAPPRAATLATVAATEVTSPRFASTHLVKVLMTAVTSSVMGFKVSVSASPTAFIVPSTALRKRRNEPPIPRSIARAVSSAAPDTSLRRARNLSISSMFAVSEIPDIMPRTSKTSFMNESLSAVGIFAVATAMSRITVAILRRLPDASTDSTPTSRSIACTFVSANWTKALRSAVPAREPLMPMLAITPRAAHVSSMDSPQDAACGAAILRPSKRSVRVCADPFAVAVRTSETCDILPASNPKMRSELAAMSADSARSVPVARERFRTLSIAETISEGLKPIRPRPIIASATCWAVNDVSRPRRCAVLVSWSNCSPVENVTAWTSRILSSNPAKDRSARMNGSESAPPKAIMSRPSPWQAFPKSRSCDCAALRLARSFEVSAVTST